MMSGMSTYPAVITQETDLDPLETADAVWIAGSQLKVGNVLLDELDLPAMLLVERQRAPRNSGAVAFVGEDLCDGTYDELQLHANKQFKVMAR